MNIADANVILIGGHTVFTFDKKLNQMLDELRNT